MRVNNSQQKLLCRKIQQNKKTLKDNSSYFIRIMFFCILFFTSNILRANQLEENMCSISNIQNKLHWFKRISLNINGSIPSIEQYEKIIQNPSAINSIVNNMLNSEAFIDEIMQYHKALLWANISKQPFSSGAWHLNEPNISKNIPAYYVRQRAIRYRGQRIPCKNEPAQFDTDGLIKTTKHPTLKNVYQEGWVEIKPYWLKTGTIKVCAFDAQDEKLVAKPTKRNPDATFNCEKNVNHVLCGCGPNLKWCQATYLHESEDGKIKKIRTHTIIAQSMMKQMLLFIGNIIKNNQPYTDILLNNNTHINGPISHWLNFQTTTGGNRILSHPNQNYESNNIAFYKTDVWQPVLRNKSHSGLLTLPLFLLRFQSNRSRANKFYQAFLCNPFIAPSSGIPASSDACNDEPNLQERCGCKYCHVTLEPAASYWGRWIEPGVGPMPSKDFPTYNEQCDKKGRNSALCRLFYLQPKDATHKKLEPFIGTLNSYLFATKEMIENIELGPKKLAQKAIETKQFATCTTKNIWNWLIGSPAGTENEQIINKLANDFINSNYNLKELVKNVIYLPEYQIADVQMLTKGDN